MNSNHLASIARSEKICFDYMDFLSASCRKHWRFVDAIYGVMPIFGMVLKSRVTTSQTRKEQLKELALQVVSTQVSDETNIVRLIDLAQQQTGGDIQLPCMRWRLNNWRPFRKSVRKALRLLWWVNA